MEEGEEVREEGGRDGEERKGEGSWREKGEREGEKTGREGV